MDRALKDLDWLLCVAFANPHGDIVDTQLRCNLPGAMPANSVRDNREDRAARIIPAQLEL